LRLFDDLRRFALFEIRFRSQQGKFELRNVDVPCFVARVLGALGVFVRERMAKMTGGMVRVALDDEDALGHFVSHYKKADRAVT
jgi:hypothetical protein